MNEDTPLTPEQEDDALAAELALGLLDGDEAQAAVARLAQDPAFAQAVRDWQERLAGLALNLTPVMAPARARQRIREQLGHGRAPLADDPSARAAPWWRGPIGALTGLVAVAAVALFLWMPGQTPTTAPVAADYQAQLVSEDDSLRVAARLDGREMEIALAFASGMRHAGDRSRSGERAEEPLATSSPAAWRPSRSSDRGGDGRRGGPPPNFRR